MKKKRMLSIAALCLVITLCLSTLCINLIIKDEAKEAQAAAVGAGTASVLNLDDKGLAHDYFSNVITGAQNEYIYLGENVSSTTANTPGYLNSGTNGHTGAVKWRVLSTTDTKYNSAGGTWLLWSDYSLGCGFYNPWYNNPYYAFWGNSMIRAKLNGGNRQYLNKVSSNGAIPTLNQTVSNEDSWLYQVFKKQEERDNIVPATSYDTYCFNLFSGSSATETILYTQGIVGTSGNKYSSSIINNSNNRGTNAIIFTGDSVKESDIGDYLFFIDIDDVNNTNLGFGVGGITYSKKVNPSWISYYDDGATIDVNVTSADLISLSDPNDCWLRAPGLWSNKTAAILGINKNGTLSVPYADNKDGNVGVRPAFNFSPANVLYATAADMSVVANPSSGGDTFTSVSAVNGAKPAY